MELTENLLAKVNNHMNKFVDINLQKRVEYDAFKNATDEAAFP